MIKWVFESKKLIQMLICFLSLGVGVGPVFAQAYPNTRFVKPLIENGSGDSFRSKGGVISDVEDGRLGADNSQTLLNKGNMISQPTMSGLLYQVHVLGEVKSPGTYRVMASERLSEVMQRAGGIAQQGSERKIEIRREGKTIKTVDLMKFQVYGQLDHNPYLLDNDVVYVPLKGQSVQIVGAVKRPNTYELVGEKNISQAIQLAGGLSAGIAKNEPIRIIRFVDGKKEVIEVPFNETEFKGASISGGDVVYIPNVITAGHKFDYDIAQLPGDNVFYPSYEDRVFVLGGVAAPSPYPFNPYYNVSQYISLAGGFTKMSTGEISILTPEGKRYKVKRNKKVVINPGDTILVGERRIPPEGWVGLFMSLGSFGLSTTATVLALTKK